MNYTLRDVKLENHGGSPEHRHYEVIASLWLGDGQYTKVATEAEETARALVKDTLTPALQSLPQVIDLRRATVAERQAQAQLQMLAADRADRETKLFEASLAGDKTDELQKEIADIISRSAVIDASLLRLRQAVEMAEAAAVRASQETWGSVNVSLKTRVDAEEQDALNALKQHSELLDNYLSARAVKEAYDRTASRVHTSGPLKHFEP
jgi:hypothetical protein